MKSRINSCDALRIIDDVPIEKDDWRLQLHNGDEITIDNGQNEPLSEVPTVIIQSIEYFYLKSKNPVAKIVTKDGERIECFVKEIH